MHERLGSCGVRVNGDIRDLSEDIKLEKKKKHTIEIVVDRLIVGEGEDQDKRIADSVETALKLGSGVVKVSIIDDDEMLFSEHFACVQCGISLGEIEPRTFSFNSPHGACPTCSGLGAKMEIDPDLVIPNKDLAIAEGAIQPWARAGTMSSWYASTMESVAKAYGFSTKAPVKKLKPEHVEIILHGNNHRSMVMSHTDRRGKVWKWNTNFEGVINNLARRYGETESDYTRSEIERYMTSNPCPACNGKRLKPESLAVTVAASASWT